MGLFRRVNDIISANINDMVDRFENPEKMLRQAVREMDARIQSALDSAARVIANERLLAKQIDDYRCQRDQWNARARTAVEQSKDDLARRSLVRQSELETLIKALNDQHEAARQASTRLRGQIDAMRVRVIEAKRKLVTLGARQKAAEARKQLARDLDSGAEFDSVFGRFDRMANSVDRTEAEADALLELKGDAEIDEPEFDGIQQKLDAIKASLAR
ncbi:MAG: PspA/IM30 family protein [Planctomycetota bacterium]|nr:PspA/IM30 family protein [Planctomycetota bacterium]